MAEPKTSAPIHDQDVGFIDDDLAAPQTKRMPEEPTRDTPSRKRLKVCPDEDPTARNPAPAHQFIKDNSPQNTKAPPNAALWNDTTHEVYEHLKNRAEKLEDAPIHSMVDASSSKKDTPKSDAPSEDGTRGNIYETLLGRIQSTLKQLHDQHEEMKQPSADPTTSCPTTDTNLNPSNPSIPPNNEHSPSPCTKASPKPSSSSTKRKRSTRKRSGPSMRIFAVKGTKAERLREYMKYFPKPPSPTPSPPSSPPFKKLFTKC
ncbi:hypothetical protein N0V85_003961 [Neurospora sp. IMI 360204]|nr:hypothetical protein N0V85_003961 [Neurospora sp. IMI 360204]